MCSDLSSLNRAARHVLPIFLDDLSRGMFSAVALRVASHRFLLTAGHCLADERSGHWNIGAPMLRRAGDGDVVRLTNVRARGGACAASSGTIDVGVLEVFPIDEASLDAFDSAALGLDAISLVRSSELVGADVTFFGYPGALASSLGGHMLTPCSCSAPIADGVDEPALPHPSPFRIDVALPLTRIRDAFDRAGALPILQGVSGGAYWIDRDGAFVLIGTHSGSTEIPCEIEGELYRFASGYSLHNHLALLVSTWPELRNEVCARWPEVAAIALT